MSISPPHEKWSLLRFGNAPSNDTYNERGIRGPHIPPYGTPIRIEAYSQMKVIACMRPKNLLVLPHIGSFASHRPEKDKKPQARESQCVQVNSQIWLCNGDG